MSNEASNDLSNQTISLFLFELYDECFAFPTQCLKEVIEVKKVHAIPHRHQIGLRGLVNYSGQLRLCYDLGKLFNMQVDESNTKSKLNHVHRFLVVENKGNILVFEADSVKGHCQVKLDIIEALPLNIIERDLNYLKGIVHVNGKSVAIIDDELLFNSIIRSLS